MVMSLITFAFASDLKNILEFLPLNIIPTTIVGIDLIGSALINKIFFEKKNSEKINYTYNIKRYIILRCEQAKLVSKKIINENMLKELNNNIDYSKNNNEKEIYQLENLNNKEVEKKSFKSSCNKINNDVNSSNKYFIVMSFICLAVGNVAFLRDSIMPNLWGIIAPCILGNIVCAKDILNLRKYSKEAIEEVKEENPRMISNYSEDEIVDRENKIAKLKLNLIVNNYILENNIEKEIVDSNLDIKNDYKLTRKK